MSAFELATAEYGDLNWADFHSDSNSWLPSPTSAEKSGMGFYAPRAPEIGVTEPVDPADTAVAHPHAAKTLLKPFDRGTRPEVDLLAEWSGRVTKIDTLGHTFSAVLEGVRGEGVVGQREDATIPIVDVSRNDRELFREGNFFRLCVVHEVTEVGDSRRYTQIVFRRLPSYRQADLDRADARATELIKRIRIDEFDPEGKLAIKRFQ